MAEFKDIDEARKLLGLNEEATMEEIKDAFRKLAIKYHPDKHKGKDKKRYEELFKRVSHAKDTITSYCVNYRFSFREKEVKSNSMDKEEYFHLKRFYDGWFGDLGL